MIAASDDQIVEALEGRFVTGTRRGFPAECHLDAQSASFLAEVIEPIIKARELEAKANALETFDFDLFARCLGGDAAWVTTATKVGDLVGLWLRDEAEAYRAEATS